MSGGYYERGKGRTFTPSSEALWVEDFNRTIDKEKVSRNKLTEMLIELGLNYKQTVIDDNSVSLPIPEDLSQDQVKFLKSDQGKQMISNMISYVLNIYNGHDPIQNVSSYKEIASSTITEVETARKPQEGTSASSVNTAREERHESQKQDNDTSTSNKLKMRMKGIRFEDKT